MSKWKAKRSNNFEQKKKDFIYNHNFRNNNTCNFPNKNFQGNKGNSQSNPNGPRNKEPTNNHSNYVKNNERKEPIKCWDCNGPHYASVFPNRKNIVSNIHTVQEEMIVGDLARKIPRINAALENEQVHYQTSIVEVEGKLNQTPISILIDPGASLSYVSPNLIEKCNLSVEKVCKVMVSSTSYKSKKKSE